VITIRITETVSQEYDIRCPDFLPLDKLRVGKCLLTLDEARKVLADAEYNSDPEAVEVGEYGVPLGTYNAYRALARQVRKAIDLSETARAD